MAQDTKQKITQTQLKKKLKKKQQIRSDATKRDRNRYQVKTTRTFIKKLLKSNEHGEAMVIYKEVCSMVDKLSKKNIIHKNNAANKKSKLAKYVNSLHSN